MSNSSTLTLDMNSDDMTRKPLVTPPEVRCPKNPDIIVKLTQCETRIDNLDSSFREWKGEVRQMLEVLNAHYEAIRRNLGESTSEIRRDVDKVKGAGRETWKYLLGIGVGAVFFFQCAITIYVTFFKK